MCHFRGHYAFALLIKGMLAKQNINLSYKLLTVYVSWLLSNSILNYFKAYCLLSCQEAPIILRNYGNKES